MCYFNREIPKIISQVKFDNFNHKFHVRAFWILAAPNRSVVHFYLSSLLNIFRGRGIYMGGVHTHRYKLFLFLNSFFKILKKILLVFSKLSQETLTRMSRKWFSWHPKGLCTPINPRVFFQTQWPRQVG